MAKRIPYQAKYLNLERLPVLTQEREKDTGELLWDVPPDEKAERGTTARLGKAKQRHADTFDLIHDLLLTLSSITALHKPEDPRRVQGIYVALDAAKERSEAADAPHDARDVLLGNESYTWLHAMLRRTIPFTAMYAADVASAAKARGDQEPTFAWWLWRNNAELLQNELRDRSDTAYVVDWEDKT